MEEGVYQVKTKKMLCANLAKENVVFMLNVHTLHISLNRQLSMHNFMKFENVHLCRNNF